MTVRRALVWLLASWAVNVVAARILDSFGLVESLLSPSGGRLLLIVPLAVCFYFARFVAWFFAPGLLLGALIAAGLRRTPSRRVGA